MNYLITTWVWGLAPMMLMAVIAWLICTGRRNVGLIDIFWSLFLLSAGITYALLSSALNWQSWLVLSLLILWSLRLAVHLALRNWNAAEDHRYQEIRARNQPGFAWKSFYLVFLLQAVLAWIISVSLAASIVEPSIAGHGASPVLVFAGAALSAFGFVFEAVADWQLAQFKKDRSNQGRVMQSGLWRYSRHPNYFGECCFWWGMFLMGVTTATVWTVISPLLMTVLLLKVSGVTLLEKDIAQRRPAYRDYVASTSAFFPWPPKVLS